MISTHRQGNGILPIQASRNAHGQQRALKSWPAHGGRPPAVDAWAGGHRAGFTHGALPGGTAFECAAHRAAAICGTRRVPTPCKRAQTQAPPATRDYKRFPIVVERPAASVIYAVSDVHGRYDELLQLLHRWGLVESAHSAPEAVEWTGEQATLVVVGDMINKGPRQIDVLQMLATLESQARRSGGELVVLLGNHEAEFLADPDNRKANSAAGINQQIRAMHLTPQQFASDTSAYGQWLRTRPLAAKIGDWFFCHAGFTNKRSIAGLEQTLEAALNRDGFAARAIIGPNSLLEARHWWHHPRRTAARCARALDVRHIVFGHDPTALGSKARFGVAQHGRLLRIDCSQSHLKLLRIQDAWAEELNAAGAVRRL